MIPQSQPTAGGEPVSTSPLDQPVMIEDCEVPNQRSPCIEGEFAAALEVTGRGFQNKAFLMGK